MSQKRTMERIDRIRMVNSDLAGQLENALRAAEQLDEAESPDIKKLRAVLTIVSDPSARALIEEQIESASQPPISVDEALDYAQNACGLPPLFVVGKGLKKAAQDLAYSNDPEVAEKRDAEKAARELAKAANSQNDS